MRTSGQGRRVGDGDGEAGETDDAGDKDDETARLDAVRDDGKALVRGKYSKKRGSAKRTTTPTYATAKGGTVIS
jgi:hypothetical protein